MPVRVVVLLLIALKSIPGSTRILSSGQSAIIIIEDLISSEEALIAIPGITCLVKGYH